jgi:hypothetical protein
MVQLQQQELALLTILISNHLKLLLRLRRKLHLKFRQYHQRLLQRHHRKRLLKKYLLYHRNQIQHLGLIGFLYLHNLVMI